MIPLSQDSLTARSISAKMARRQERYASTLSTSYLYQAPKPPAPPPEARRPAPADPAPAPAPRPSGESLAARHDIPMPQSLFELLHGAEADLEPHGGGTPFPRTRRGLPDPQSAAGPAAQHRLRNAVLSGTAALALCGVAGGSTYYAWVHRGLVDGATGAPVLDSRILASARPLPDLGAEPAGPPAAERTPAAPWGQDGAAELLPLHSMVALPSLPIAAAPPPAPSAAAGAAELAPAAAPAVKAAVPQAAPAGTAAPVAAPPVPSAAAELRPASLQAAAPVLPAAQPAPAAAKPSDAGAPPSPAPVPAITVTAKPVPVPAETPPTAAPKPDEAAVPVPRPARLADGLLAPVLPRPAPERAAAPASAPKPVEAAAALPAPASLAVPAEAPPPVRAAQADAPNGAAALPPGFSSAQQLSSTLTLVNQIALLVHDMHDENIKYRAQMTTLTSTVQARESDIERRLRLAEARSSIAAAIDAHREPAPGPAEPDQDPAAAGGARAPVRTASAPRSVRDYRIRRASYNHAVLVDLSAPPDQAVPREVVVGDQVPGVGRVTTIAVRGGVWVVQTDHGAIQ